MAFRRGWSVEASEYEKYLAAHAPCALGVYQQAILEPNKQVEYCIKKGKYIEGKDYVKLDGLDGEALAAAIAFNAMQAAGRMIGHARR